MFPIVPKREVKKEWKTGRDGFHPKLKQQVLCLSASERTIKAKHVLISPFKHAGCILFRERPRICVETTNGLVSMTMKIALGQNPGLLSRWNWHEVLYFLQESTL